MPSPITISDRAKSAIKPLPSFLTQRHNDWRQHDFDEVLFGELAHGQSPHSMVISCCDSRCNPTELLNFKSGECFVHRNIANIVPICDAKGMHHSTAAAMEFAVTALNVQHIIVIGHAACAGINAGFHQCKNTAIAREDFGSLQKWLDLAAPAYARLDHSKPDHEQIKDLEQLSVVVSLEHMMGYPFIHEAVENGALSLHGLWHDIRSGNLHAVDPETAIFSPI